MNILKLTIAITIISFMPQLQAQGFSFVRGDNKITTKICISAAQDKPHKVKFYARESRMNLKSVVKKVKCNNIAIIDFAFKYNALKVYSLLERYEVKHGTITDLTANSARYQQ